MYTVLKGKVALTQKESKPKIYKWKGKNKRVSQLSENSKKPHGMVETILSYLKNLSVFS